ncbi:hypothetical protein I7I51_03560, partial [Histoplasma capsulatum]
MSSVSIQQQGPDFKGRLITQFHLYPLYASEPKWNQSSTDEFIPLDPLVQTLAGCHSPHLPLLFLAGLHESIALWLRSTLWLGQFLSTTARIAVPESFECHDGWMPLVEVSDEQSDTVLVT